MHKQIMPASALTDIHHTAETVYDKFSCDLKSGSQ